MSYLSVVGHRGGRDRLFEPCISCRQTYTYPLTSDTSFMDLVSYLDSTICTKSLWVPQIPTNLTLVDTPTISRNTDHDRRHLPKDGGTNRQEGINVDFDERNLSKAS